MNRIKGKTALITGATAGIGEASARAFAAMEVNLILLARREERLDPLKEELEQAHGIDVLTKMFDVRLSEAASQLADELEAAGKVPDILLNNAGKACGMSKLHEGDLDDWEEMIDTNVKGLLYMTRAILPMMVARDSGHVINIGSIAGHQVYPLGNVYNATKFAVRALSEGMNLDVAGTKVRVSSIDPGLVQTEFSEVRFRGDKERAAGIYEGYTPLAGEDVAEVVVFVANRPAHVDILDLVILPTDQRSAHVVHKELGDS